MLVYILYCSSACSLAIIFPDWVKGLPSIKCPLVITYIGVALKIYPFKL